MTARVSTQALYVDHVLGWAAPFGDADAAGGCAPKVDVRTGVSRVRELKTRARDSDETEDDR